MREMSFAVSVPHGTKERKTASSLTHNYCFLFFILDRIKLNCLIKKYPFFKITAKIDEIQNFLD